VSSDERHVQVTFEFEPPEQCPLADVGSGSSKVIVSREGDACKCDIVAPVQIDGDVGTIVAHVSTDDIRRCPGTVFHEFDCVPEIVDVTESSLVVRTFAHQNIAVDDLIEDLSEVCDDVKLGRVTTDIDECLGENVRDVDLSGVTEKQREAIEMAIKEGYYARPRDVTLAEMAQEFDISEQALAQRLARAEERVLDQIFS